MNTETMEPTKEAARETRHSCYSAADAILHAAKIVYLIPEGPADYSITLGLLDEIESAVADVRGRLEVITEG